jgi:hypothetical protein
MMSSRLLAGPKYASSDGPTGTRDMYHALDVPSVLPASYSNMPIRRRELFPIPFLCEESVKPGFRSVGMKRRAGRRSWIFHEANDVIQTLNEMHPSPQSSAPATKTTLSQ